MWVKEACSPEELVSAAWRSRIWLVRRGACSPVCMCVGVGVGVVVGVVVWVGVFIHTYITTYKPQERLVGAA